MVWTEVTKKVQAKLLWTLSFLAAEVNQVLKQLVPPFPIVQHISHGEVLWQF